MAELEKKYGVTFATDENGAKVLDEDKLTEAVSQKLSRARAEAQILENRRLTQTREVAQKQAFGSIQDLKQGLESYRLGSAAYYKVNGHDIYAGDFNAYANRFLKLKDEDLSGEDAEQKIRDALGDADEYIIQFFLSKLQQLNKAIEDEQNAGNFVDLISSTLRGKNLYVAAAESGSNREAVDAAINKYAQNQIGQYTEEQNNNGGLDAIAQYEQDHNAKYSNGKFYGLTESGEIDKQNVLDTTLDEAIAIYAKARVDQDLASLDADKIAEIINQNSENGETIIDEGMIAKLAQEEANNKQLLADTKRATELGFDKEEYQEYVEYLQRTNKNLAENQELADATALANMRLDRGVQTLADNMDEWTDILETASKKGNE